MSDHEKINYVEFPSRNLVQTKVFFRDVFGWEFVDYGPEYTAFTGEGLDGGFYQADLSSSSVSGAALLVFFSRDLESTQKKIKENGGVIIKPIFSFPGGRRFHFTEPAVEDKAGNEFAVWSSS